MAVRLIQFRLCPRSRSVRLALAELGHEVILSDENPWDWRQGFLAKNPAGEFPVIEFEDGLSLAGAYAISEYLAERPAPAATLGQSRAPELFPGDREDRAEVRRLVDWFHGKFDREVTRELLFEKVYQRMRPTGNSPPDADVLRSVRANLRYHLSYIAYLSESRRWLAGDELSFADLAAAAQLSTVDYLDELPWRDNPSVQTWYQRVKSRPSFRSLLTDKVPGMTPPTCYADLDF
jgi:glutathione S-transferase